MTRSSAPLFRFTAAYALLLAYLSFLPFHYQALPFEDALKAFQQLPWLALRASRRADWIANALMAVPLALLLAVAVDRSLGKASAVLVMGVAVAATFVWGIVIEFGQLYFPARTTSLNDIAAQLIGSVVGALIWAVARDRVPRWWSRFIKGGGVSRRLLLDAYLFVYLVLTVAPFDVAFSLQEIAEKLASDRVAFVFATATCGPLACAGKWLVEVIAAVPLGVWWQQRRGHASGVLGALVVGLATGLVLETVQLFIVSPIVQGASVISRAIGVVAGAAIFAGAGTLVPLARRHWRPVVLAGVVLYGLALGVVNGWIGSAWDLSPALLERVHNVQLLPFYHHYFTGELDAIRSSVWHMALYAPVGLAVWLADVRRGTASHDATSAVMSRAARVAAAVAFVAESGKLLVANRHPDYSDILIGALAASLAAGAMRVCLSPPRPAASAPVSSPVTIRVSERNGGTWPLARIIGATLLALAICTALTFPVAQVALLMGLATIAFAVWRWPASYLVWLPAIVLLVDLAPWSGRLLWDESDACLAVVLALRLWCGGTLYRLTRPLWAWIAGALLACLLLSALLGMGQADWNVPVNATASSYLGSLNGLRILRGFAWCLIFLGLIADDVRRLPGAGWRVVQGLGLAAASAALGVVVERSVLLGGAWNLTSGIRSGGLSSAAHVGGAYLDALLLMSIPFAALCAIVTRRRTAKWIWAIVAVVATAAAVSTYARAAWVGLTLSVGLGSVLYMTSTLRSAVPTRTMLPSRMPWLLGVALVMVAAAGASTPVLRDRFGQWKPDLETRIEHWSTSLDLIGESAGKVLFGIGLGRYPSAYYFATSADTPHAAHRIVAIPDRSGYALRLYGGRGYFIDQRLGAVESADYSVDVFASADRGAHLSVAVCRKSLLYSSGCSSHDFTLEQGNNRLSTTLRIPQAMATAWPSRTFSISVSTPGAIVEVQRVSLRHGGRELLTNGDFSSAMDRWMFASDDHLAWRATSTPLHTAVELGSVGLVALVVATLWMLGRLTRVRGPTAVAALCAWVALAAVALTEYPFDSSRVMLVVAWLICASVCASEIQRDLRPSNSKR